MSRRRSQIAREEGRAGVAARRRHLAMRPDRRPRARRRLQQIHGRGRRARCRGAARPGAARRRHGAAQRAAAPAQTVVPGRCLDRRPRDDRRHDRQQQLRLALDPLRQHGAQRARRSTRCSPTAPQAHFGEVPGQFRRGCRSPSAIATWCATCARCTAARPTRSSARFPKLLRRVGGYNIDMIDDAGHNMAHLLVGSRGHARLLQRDRARPAADPAAPGARHLPFPELLPGDGGDPAHRQARPGRGRAGRPHDDRTGARHPDVPRRSSTASSRASRRRSC